MKQYGFSQQVSRVIRKSDRGGGSVQRMAWVATRPLGQHEGSKGKDWNMGFGNSKLNHRHFIFDDQQPLPTGQEDNIGFHCATGGLKGHGELFSEAWGSFGYTKREVVSHNAAEDNILVQAIEQHNPPGNYNLITHNCQHWVTEVRQTAGL